MNTAELLAKQTQKRYRVQEKQAFVPGTKKGGSIRRRSRAVQVGSLTIGGAAPLAIQSMTTTRTLEVEETLKQVSALAGAGCDLVRMTAQTSAEAGALRTIRDQLMAAGHPVPLAADIHFNPKAALEAAEHVEKIRINPGNYADPKRFAQRSYSDAEYQRELKRVTAAARPLMEKCKQLGRALRIGTNHGSLSDRIMNRYGDTPLGMVESAMEYLRIAESSGFKEVIFSMKASNPVVMLQANRLLVAALSQQGEHYPLHLGVTEAGAGEDARLKSALGIGVLLAEGIGDTIRVSLTEDPVREIPVAKALAQWAQARWRTSKRVPPPLNAFSWKRRASQSVRYEGVAIGGDEPVRVGLMRDAACTKGSDPLVQGYEFVLSYSADAREKVHLIEAEELLAEGRSIAHQTEQFKDNKPIVLVWDARRFEQDDLSFLIEAAVQVGGLLVDGIGDAVVIHSSFPAKRILQLTYDLLQAARARSVKAEYIACPGCGRTLFDLEPVTRRIKEKTEHLKGVKIAVMGCIVNGPGEMADADFGFVGGSPGTINLYVGREMVERGIPEAEAEDRLVTLIRSRGKWVDP